MKNIDIDKTVVRVYITGRYFEDTKVNGKYDDKDNPSVCGYNPEKKYVMWDILPKDGRIKNWNGQKVDALYKLVDEGEYVLEVNGETLEDVESYVPDFLAIDEPGFGDYVDLTINEDGTINGWSDEQRNQVIKFFNGHSESENYVFVENCEKSENECASCPEKVVKEIALSVEEMKNLQKLGLDTSDASMYWYVDEPHNFKMLMYCEGRNGNDDEGNDIEIVPAYNLQDILDALPKEIFINGRRFYLEMTWMNYFCTFAYSTKCVDGTTRAKFVNAEPLFGAYSLLVWCLENGLCDLKEL